VTKHKF